MEKLFISLPMRDKTNEQIRVKREKLHHDAQRILGHEVEVIDTFFEDVPHEATVFSTPDWCIDITSMFPSTR